jgi:hypothetical protein
VLNTKLQEIPRGWGGGIFFIRMWKKLFVVLNKINKMINNNFLQQD